MPISEEEETLGVCGQRGKAIWEHHEKKVVYKPRGKASPETGPAGNMSLD